MKTFRLPLALAAAIALVPAGVTAQESDNDNILAQGIIVSALSVAGQQNLDFGFLLRGVNKTLAATIAQGGVFEVQGQAGAEVSLNFGTLPTVMTCTTAATCTTSEIPLTSPTTAWTINNGTTTIPFTPPATDAATHPILNGSGLVDVMIGATAEPAADQAAGTYQATITLTATYTGN